MWQAKKMIHAEPSIYQEWLGAGSPDDADFMEALLARVGRPVRIYRE
jgi:hypothetical protein